MITKQNNNTGASGGNAMSEVKIDNEKIIESELFWNYKKNGVSISCPKCQTEFILKSQNHTSIIKAKDSFNDGACPFCKGQKTMFPKLPLKPLEFTIEHNGDYGPTQLNLLFKPDRWQAMTQSTLKGNGPEVEIIDGVPITKCKPNQSGKK